jgi:hypothetical protein
VANRDKEFDDALVNYEVARLTFRSVANSISHRLAAGRLPTENETIVEEEARAAIAAARRRLLAAAAVKDPASIGALTDNVIAALLAGVGNAETAHAD